MSVRTVTLQNLRDAVARRADITIQASGVRHTEALVDADINAAIQKWKLHVANCGDEIDLASVRVTTNTSTTKDAANWAPCEYITQPSGAMFIKEVAVWSGSQRFPLLPVSKLTGEIAKLVRIYWTNGVYGIPRFYKLGGKNAAGADLIQIFPNANAVYQVDVFYIPAHTDLTNPASTIEIQHGGDEFIVNDVVAEILRTDMLAGTPEYAASVRERDKAKEEMAFALAKKNPVGIQDTWAYQQDLLRYLRGLV